MIVVLLSILFIFGVCVGSFLNVVIYRLNNGFSPLKGRSFCPKCKHQLAWFDNIPLLSFVVLRGKCRYCQSPISRQYPLVELATGIITLLIFNLQFTIYNQFSIFNLLIAYCFLVIFVSDLRYGIIPDEVVVFGVVVALVKLLFERQALLPFILAGLGGLGFFGLLVWITKGKGMGWGDVKLAFLIGLLLGWQKGIAALYLSFLTGAIVGVILILVGKKRFGQTVPFGPFLVICTYIAMYFGEKIIKIWPGL